ncbi:MAG: TatD family hydrolase [Candidatus Paceibacterota bacterium]
MQPKIFDIHSHLNFHDFDKDREETIKRMQENNIWTICVGADGKTSQECVELAEKYENIYASVGLHPNDDEIFDAEYYKKLAQHPKVVAIGECGIDLYRQKNDDLKRQKDLFIKHIELALELNKPLMIHCRDAAPATPERSDGGQAHDDVINIVSSFRLHAPRLRGNVHFFSGTWEQAQRYFDLGFTISFAGPITFPPSGTGFNQYDETIKNAPIDKIMIETDAPFAAPAPQRGKRNEPIYVVEVAKKIAELKNMPVEEILKITAANALRLFLGYDL